MRKILYAGSAEFFCSNMSSELTGKKNWKMHSASASKSLCMLFWRIMSPWLFIRCARLSGLFSAGKVVLYIYYIIPYIYICRYIYKYVICMYMCVYIYIYQWLSNCCARLSGAFSASKVVVYTYYSNLYAYIYMYLHIIYIYLFKYTRIYIYIYIYIYIIAIYICIHIIYILYHV